MSYADGFDVGTCVGLLVGVEVGMRVGLKVGAAVGFEVGSAVIKSQKFDVDWDKYVEIQTDLSCLFIHQYTSSTTLHFTSLPLTLFHFNVVQCNAIQHNTIQCNKLQYNTLHHYAEHHFKPKFLSTTTYPDICRKISLYFFLCPQCQYHYYT